MRGKVELIFLIALIRGGFAKLILARRFDTWFLCIEILFYHCE